MRIWLLLSLLFGYCSLAVAANTPNAADLQRLKKNITDIEQRISRSTGESNKLQQALQQEEVELAKLERALSELNQAVAQQQKTLNQLQQQETGLVEQKRQQENSIGDYISLSYRMGREKNIKLLLNQQSPDTLTRMRNYADYFNRAHVDAMLQYQKTLDEIEQNKQAIDTQSKQLLVSKTQLTQKKQQLQQHYQQRARTLAALQSDIKSDTQQLQKWQQEQKQLETLLKQVNEAIANIRLPNDSVAFTKMKGKLPWPTKGKMDARFGKLRATGDLRWEGIAILAPSGQSVQAIHHGRVVFADWFRGKGLLLIIDHGDGYMSLYAHNQTLLKEPGDWVSIGEAIATVGESGGLSNPELYFEIRSQGKPVNPSQWLRRG